ncbi:Phospholipase C [Serendipita sp. 399]|nr:Phospholipase C [Serendipita sp. 399]
MEPIQTQVGPEESAERAATSIEAKQTELQSQEAPPASSEAPAPEQNRNPDTDLLTSRAAPTSSTTLLQVPSAPPRLSSSVSSPSLPTETQQVPPSSWRLRNASSLGRLGTTTNDGNLSENGPSEEIVQDEGETAEDEGYSNEPSGISPGDRERGDELSAPELKRSRSSSAKKALGSAIGSIKRRIGIGKKDKEKNKEDDSRGRKAEKRSRPSLLPSMSTGGPLLERDSQVDGSSRRDEPSLRTGGAADKIGDSSSDGLAADPSIVQEKDANVKRRTSFRDSLRAKRESFRFRSKVPGPDHFAFGARSAAADGSAPTTAMPWNEEELGENEEASRPATFGYSNPIVNESIALVASPVDIVEENGPEMGGKDSPGVEHFGGTTQLSSIQAVMSSGIEGRGTSPSPSPSPARHAATAPAASSTRLIRAEGDVGASATISAENSEIPLLDYDRAVKSLDSGLQNAGDKPKRPELLISTSSSSSSIFNKPNGGVKAFDGLEDIAIPTKWLTGAEMLKVAEKEEKRRKVRLDPEQGLLLWETKKGGMITIENIKEIRVGADARYYREHFEMPTDYEQRWMTISYLADGKYKTLHLVALSMEDFSSFHDALIRLRALRFAMLSLPSNPMIASLALPDANIVQTSVPAQISDSQSVGSHSHGHTHIHGHGHHRPHLAHPHVHGHLHHHSHSLGQSHSGHRHLTHDQRQTLWERHYWKGADLSGDKRLDYKEVKKMVHRLSMGLSTTELDMLFRAADKSANGTLDFEEFREFWRGRRVRKEMRVLFKEQLAFNRRLDSDGQPTTDGRLEGLTFKTFERFMREEQKDKRSSAELHEIFSCYATPLHPRKEVEGNPESQSNPSGSNSNKVDVDPSSQVLTLEGFTSYLMSSDNAPFKDQKLGVHQDMTRPLAEYYISSSHNTYLVGHQLVGDSTIEGYIRTLLHGCRSVEIDIWDGDREPVITHGGTLTSKIALRTICEVIAKNAFTASPYPVIISAEVHCGIAQQEKIAEIMKECFGALLIDRRLESDSDTGEPLKYLPSPEMLKGRILLKTKKPAHLIAGVDTTVIGNTAVIDTDGGTETAVTSDPEILPAERRGSSNGRRGSRSSARRSIPIPRQTTNEFDDGESIVIVGSNSSHGSSILLRRGSLSKPKPFSSALANLLIYTVGVKCRGINKKEMYAPEHMFSLSEKKVDKMLKEGGIFQAIEDSNEEDNFISRNPSGGMLDLIKHTQGHLVRTYPKGLRLSSSNYLPHRYWAAGIQLVALNWQTSDLGCMINHAMFLRNGKAGYVLKPACLRSKDKTVKEVVTRRKRYCLDVKVISAQQIPRPRNKDGREIVDKSTMDPFVQVAVYVPDWPGAPTKTGVSTIDSFQASTSPSKTSSLRRESTDATVKPRRYVIQSASTPAEVIKAQTGIVKNNGFNPIWNEQMRLQFEVAGDMLDLVFVRFVVRDEGDDEDATPLALYCMSLGSLNQGYRHLPLHDQQMSQYLFASLFVKLDLREVTP